MITEAPPDKSVFLASVEEVPVPENSILAKFDGSIVYTRKKARSSRIINLPPIMSRAP